MLAKIKPNQRGFTLVEVNTAAALIAILGISLITIFTTFITTSNRTSHSLELTNQSQNLLRVLVEELRYGAGVRQFNQIADPSEPTGWNTSNTDFVIITTVPALDSSREYIIDPDTGAPYLNEYVYYRQGATLYKRTLAHPAAVDNRAKTSCQTPIAGCSVFDRTLTEGLSSINFTLYDQDNITTANPLLARSVKIDLTLEKRTFGRPLTFDNSVRTTLRNTFE